MTQWQIGMWLMGAWTVFKLSWLVVHIVKRERRIIKLARAWQVQNLARAA